MCDSGGRCVDSCGKHGRDHRITLYNITHTHIIPVRNLVFECLYLRTLMCAIYYKVFFKHNL